MVNSARASRSPWRKGTARAWNRMSPTEAGPTESRGRSAHATAGCCETAMRAATTTQWVRRTNSPLEADVHRHAVRLRQELEIAVGIVETGDRRLHQRERELHAESGREPFGVV